MARTLDASGQAFWACGLQMESKNPGIRCPDLEVPAVLPVVLSGSRWRKYSGSFWRLPQKSAGGRRLRRSACSLPSVQPRPSVQSFAFVPLRTKSYASGRGKASSIRGSARGHLRLELKALGPSPLPERWPSARNGQSLASQNGSQWNRPEGGAPDAALLIPVTRTS